MAGLRIALDTNLLAYETPRRLLAGAIASCGGEVVVLPTVYESTVRRLRHEEAAYWDTRLAADLIDTATALAVVAACEEAVERWFDAETATGNGPWARLDHDVATAQQARRIGRNLPPGSIKIGHRGELEDRNIVGEAIIADVTLLTTHNLESIDHEHINGWLTEVLRTRDTTLLATPDECIERLAHEHGLDRYGATLSHLLREPATGESRWREEYLAGLKRCEGAGLEGLAKRARWTYDQDEGFVERIETAMRATAGTYLEGADTRRLAARRRAASEAGLGAD